MILINKVRNWLINKSYCHTENGYEHNVFTTYIFGIYEAVAYSLTGDLLIQVPLPVQPSLISKPLVFNSQFLDPSLCKRPFTSNFSQQSRRSTLREELRDPLSVFYSLLSSLFLSVFIQQLVCFWVLWFGYAAKNGIRGKTAVVNFFCFSI